MRWKLAALISIAAVIPALADRKVVSRDTIGGHTIVNTIYTQASNRRWESDSNPFVQIFNSERGSSYSVDVAARQYVESREHVEPLLVLALWIRRPPRLLESGKTVNTYYQSIDTGETRAMFGQTAHHWILRERTVAEPGACTAVSRDMERDGWYLARRSQDRTSTYHLHALEACRDNVVVHGEKPDPGFAVFETERIEGKFARTREVIELSDQPLDKALFLPPSNFARVEFAVTATWLQRLEANWQELERSFESWF